MPALTASRPVEQDTPVTPGTTWKSDAGEVVTVYRALNGRVSYATETWVRRHYTQDADKFLSEYSPHA